MEEVVTKKILWIITKGTSFLYWELSQEKNKNHHQVTAPGLSLWPPWSLRPACRLWKSACRMQYILTRTPEWQAYNCGLKIYPLKGLFFSVKRSYGAHYWLFICKQATHHPTHLLPTSAGTQRGPWSNPLRNPKAASLPSQTWIERYTKEKKYIESPMMLLKSPEFRSKTPLSH